jgi:hypothetical protein
MEMDDLFEISYKQWVTTDLCNLVIVVEPYTDFKENLLQKFNVLKNVHCVVLDQTSSLKVKEAQLHFIEYVVLCDFSENITFSMEDEIQTH